MIAQLRSYNGRLSALHIVSRAIGLWWRELFVLTAFNLAWLALQVPIVTGPGATAALVLIARRVLDGDELALRDGWEALREMLFPAWKWGVINLVIIVVIIGNFWLYQNALGLQWTLLRIVWGTIGLGWFAFSLFYWPFWFAQQDRSVRTTLRNAFLFLAKRPGLGLSLIVISGVIIAASVLITVPLATVTMTWLALIGVLAVEQELTRVNSAE